MIIMKNKKQFLCLPHCCTLVMFLCLLIHFGVSNIHFIFQYSIVTELSGPKRGANSFGVDPVNGVVSLIGDMDFDAGYHVI